MASDWLAFLERMLDIFVLELGSVGFVYFLTGLTLLSLTVLVKLDLQLLMWIWGLLAAGSWFLGSRVLLPISEETEYFFFFSGLILLSYRGLARYLGDSVSIENRLKIVIWAMVLMLCALLIDVFNLKQALMSGLIQGIVDQFGVIAAVAFQCLLMGVMISSLLGEVGKSLLYFPFSSLVTSVVLLWNSGMQFSSFSQALIVIAVVVGLVSLRPPERGYIVHASVILLLGLVMQIL